MAVSEIKERLSALPAVRPVNQHFRHITCSLSRQSKHAKRPTATPLGVREADPLVSLAAPCPQLNTQAAAADQSVLLLIDDAWQVDLLPGAPTIFLYFCSLLNGVRLC